MVMVTLVVLQPVTPTGRTVTKAGHICPSVSKTDSETVLRRVAYGQVDVALFACLREMTGLIAAD